MAQPKRRVTLRSEARKSPRLQKVLKKVGGRIRSRRHERNLSQEQAAERAKLDPKHWQAIEAGDTNLTVASLLGITRALRMSISALFEGI